MSEFDPRSEFLKMRVDPKEKVLSMAAKSNILQEFAVDVPSQSDIVQSFQVRMIVPPFLSDPQQFVLEHGRVLFQSKSQMFACKRVYARASAT